MSNAAQATGLRRFVVIESEGDVDDCTVIILDAEFRMNIPSIVIIVGVRRRGGIDTGSASKSRDHAGHHHTDSIG